MQDAPTPVTEIAAKGGKARARSLTPDQRAEIARRAAASRWGKPPLPHATHDGLLPLMDLPCAVLDDGTRVLSQRALTKAIGAPHGGHAFARRSATGVADLPIFLAVERLKPFIDADLSASLNSPIEYIPRHGGRSAFGIRAELVPAICNVWLKARDAGALTQHQQRVSAKADILMRGLAHTGIIALVDEATGYQDARARDDLARILRAFVTRELRKWVSTFPPEFYKELFRLKGWDFPKLPSDQQKRPLLVGKITNDIVYARLAPGVRRELHRLTPRDEKGRLKQKLFQRLTEDVGHPKLKEHLASVTTLMRASPDWYTFSVLVNRALPKYADLPLLDLLDETGN